MFNHLSETVYDSNCISPISMWILPYENTVPAIVEWIKNYHNLRCWFSSLKGAKKNEVNRMVWSFLKGCHEIRVILDSRHQNKNPLFRVPFLHNGGIFSTYLWNLDKSKNSVYFSCVAPALYFSLRYYLYFARCLFFSWDPFYLMMWCYSLHII